MNNKKQTNYTKQAPGVLEEFFLDELKDIYWAEKH
jgi:ferritin-like metal-binding protein YciE